MSNQLPPRVFISYSHDADGIETILAVHCRQTGGGQYFDLGIEGVAAK